MFDPVARRYSGQSLSQTYITNEKEKKRVYNERVLEVENGTFTPLVFSVYGGMGKECNTFFKRLTSMLAEKRGEKQSIVATWLRTKTSFALLRSCLVCLRGSRYHYYRPTVSNTTIGIEMKEGSSNSAIMMMHETLLIAQLQQFLYK